MSSEVDDRPDVDLLASDECVAGIEASLSGRDERDFTVTKMVDHWFARDSGGEKERAP